MGAIDGTSFLNQAIVDFGQDEKGAWFAWLACGHKQHLYHRPPFTNRPWVLTKEGRRKKLGSVLGCKVCIEGEIIPSEWVDE